MRSFSDALRGLDEAGLCALLAARDDLLATPPQDLTELITRAAAPSSVHRAMDRLNRFELDCCEGLAALPDPATTAELCVLLGVPEAPVTGALVRLRELGLIWGADQVHLVRAARQAFEPHPGGLAPPSPNPLPEETLRQATDDLPPAAVEVLHRLAWGPPTGGVRNADRPLARPVTPVEHLLARGLLRPSGPDTVLLPREVALYWRGGFRADLNWQEPDPLPAGQRPARVVLQAAIGAGHEFCHDVEAVIEAVDRRAPAVLRDGGIGVRELSGLAREVGLDPARTGFALELARASDLIVGAAPTLRVTADFDLWLKRPAAERLAVLLDGWSRTPRWYAAARGEGGHPLGPEGVSRWAPEARAAVLGRLRVGSAPDPTLLARLIDWDQPGLARVIPSADLVAAVLTECAWLGVTALDQVSELAPVAAGAELGAAVAAMFPEPVTEVVLQADLTAVAPGPLEHRVAADLRLLADQESRGGGGVYRFSAESLRRGFDAGWQSETILGWLDTHSSSGVPQPLAYLVGDVARRHGTVRVGAARAYVRIDDPAQIQAVLTHRDAAALGVRQVGAQTLVAEAEPDEVVALLQALGLAPAAEDAKGATLTSRPRRRAPGPRPGRPTAAAADPLTVARQLLAAASTARDRGMRTEETLAVLRSACAEQAAVDLDYVSADGTRVSRVLVPVDVAAGMVRLVGGGSAFSLPLARVIAARREISGRRPNPQVR